MNLSGSFISTLLQFIVVLGLLLFFHEFGHFIVARLLKIEVEEFGFGFPPRLVRLFKLGNTEFTLNWIPFGAFVRPKGENDPEIPGGLGAANPFTRLAVLLGGPAMNILVGLILFSVMLMRLGSPVTNQVQVIDVSPASPAQQAGLQPGDLLLAIDGQKVNSTDALRSAIQSHLGKQVTLDLSRSGKQLQVILTPRANPPQGQGAVGIVMGNPTRPVTLGEALPAAVAMAADQAYQMVTLPVKLIQGQANPQEGRVVGPIGMFDIYSQAVKLDSVAPANPAQPTGMNVLLFVGTISVALGLTNLLPIPALDGGRIIFILPELILRRRVPARYENLVHLIGFAALLLLMSYITIQDFTHPITLP
ncbi:MAG TPA: M50 family metallopeptidase [Anaerolineaceae bacterium]|jgi:regulator of sigma E protease